MPDHPVGARRLLLRPFEPGDLDDLYDIHSRPAVARYLYWEPRDRAEVREELEQRRKMTVIEEAGDSIRLALYLSGAGRVVGEVLLSYLDSRSRTGEFGCLLNPLFGGQGLATEAGEEVLRIAFDEVGLHRVIARLDVRNTASARLMERLGMRREAHFVDAEYVKGEWVSGFLYAILARDHGGRAS